MKEYDLIIIGAGICGMTAAIYAARANLSVCVLEQQTCGGLVNWTNTVQNVPSYPSIGGMELMEKTKEHVLSLGVCIEEVDAVVQVDLNSTPKKLITDMEEEYSAKAVLIATGRKPREFPVPTSFANIHYCSVCDGSAYKGKRIIVLGGGNSGFDESLAMLSLGVAHIHIVESFPQCAAAQATQAEALATGKVEVSLATEILAVTPRDDGKALVLLRETQTGIEHEEIVDGIFCFIGQEPNTKLFQGLVDMEQGYIKVNADMETNIAGVFAAGDVIAKKYRQITTAMGDGTIAALQASAWLRSQARLSK